jgi:hypothetical protein
MTRDEIVQIAWDVGLLMRSQQSQDEPTKLERFAERIAAAEREACAAIADKEIGNTMMLMSQPPKSSAAWNISNAIRARGE